MSVYYKTHFRIKVIQLIDANIILDVLLNRPEFVKDSALIWKLCETGKATGYVSAPLSRSSFVLPTCQWARQMMMDTVIRQIKNGLDSRFISGYLKDVFCHPVILFYAFSADYLLTN